MFTLELKKLINIKRKILITFLYFCYYAFQGFWWHKMVEFERKKNYKSRQFLLLFDFIFVSKSNIVNSNNLSCMVAADMQISDIGKRSVLVRRHF